MLPCLSLSELQQHGFTSIVPQEDRRQRDYRELACMAGTSAEEVAAWRFLMSEDEDEEEKTHPNDNGTLKAASSEASVLGTEALPTQAPCTESEPKKLYSSWAEMLKVAFTSVFARVGKQTTPFQIHSACAGTGAVSLALRVCILVAKRQQGWRRHGSGLIRCHFRDPLLPLNCR